MHSKLAQPLITQLETQHGPLNFIFKIPTHVLNLQDRLIKIQQTELTAPGEAVLNFYHIGTW